MPTAAHEVDNPRSWNAVCGVWLKPLAEVAMEDWLAVLREGK